MDRHLIGLFVEREVESRMSWSHFAAVSGVSRATLYRVKDGDPRVSQRLYRQIERALDLPFDALTAVGVHDWVTLEDDGMSKEKIAWLQRGAGNSSASGASDTPTTPSMQASGPAGERPPG